MDLYALIASEIDLRLRLTEATLAAFPPEQRMYVLRLLVEEADSLADKPLAERVRRLQELLHEAGTLSTAI